MSSSKPNIYSVPTNIITGFLGVGKTSAILHLLKSKPRNERWAVLVNEFGEIGVDGALFQGQHSEQRGIYVREVPGGCMCCAAGLPMQVALNQLLKKARPDRLLIEPTGLGHPKEVVEVLSAPYYRDALSLQKTLALVDARKLSDERYTNHDTFNQQIGIADTVVANKLDLYDDGDKQAITAYIKQNGQPHTDIIFTEHGQIPLASLQGLIGATLSEPTETSHHHHHNHTPLASEAEMPERGYIKAMNEGEGFQSTGWRFSSDKIFNHRALFSLLSGLSAERMKAVFITDSGIFGYNLTTDALTEIELDDCLESHIEIITDGANDDIESELLACMVS